MILNVKKSDLLVFDSGKNSKKKPVKLFSNEGELEYKDFAKYVAVHFDKQSSWFKHTEITNKLQKGIGILTNSASMLNRKL